VGFFACLLVGVMLSVMAYPAMTVSPSSFGVLYGLSNVSFVGGYVKLTSALIPC